MNHLSDFLPSAFSLKDLLSRESTPHLQELLDQSLMNPVNDFFKTPGKNIRSSLVELGYRLSLPIEPEVLSDAIKVKLFRASSIVELIHGGSLIVDDIQDGSTVRRNAPTLHLQYGMPLALNTGNWLYFWALGQVKYLELGAEATGNLFEDLLSLMTRAHFGQALDIGSKIDQVDKSKVGETCLASMELKTGTLMSLALRLGSAIAGERCQSTSLYKLGLSLGLLLQMFDDAENFLQVKSEHQSKRHEDLYHRRPTWVWAHAAQLDAKGYAEFIQMINLLPDETGLNEWVSRHHFAESLKMDLKSSLDKELTHWRELWSESHNISYNIIEQICHKLEKAYVS